jgi:crotonobetainyl-CoA:carnitine CoA-transferase CaiB-like acyl-CoA transferase
MTDSALPRRSNDPARPLTGTAVVELAIGVSELGLGAAGGVPGMLLADLGAEVTRVVGAPVPIDEQLTWTRVWHRDKQTVQVDDAAEVLDRLRAADLIIAYGPEDLVEARGLGFDAVEAVNPAISYLRCRPSRNSTGEVEDYGLIVEAWSGFCAQLAGHRPGPIFVDVRATGIGAAAVLTVSALGLLRRRVQTGAGGWAETSLYDGMLATLGCMIGRSERAAPEIEGYWEKGSTFPNFLYRCADGELIQVWFGGKGMYASLIEVLGDEPSVEGYYTDQMTGKLGERAARWKSFFPKKPRAEWIELIRAAGVACEPVLRPGEPLRDPHLGEVGLAMSRSADGHRDVMLGAPVSVGLLDDSAPAAPPTPATVTGAGLLDGLRVVDFSAFVAGPLAAQVLADLGADVVKVEPVGGEAMRAAAYAVAACQRGKRSLALDIGAPATRPVVEALIRGADVVLHNFRVGVAERLGIDHRTVAELNPRAVYCHASAFGGSGSRAKMPGNDALMQALTGFEYAIGGAGNDPIAATWIPIDMTGGWLAAIGIMAGLYARERYGGGRLVQTSLLGAGMLLHGGVFERDGELVTGPTLDGGQTGYGPGYRIYPAGDDSWLALVVPGPAAWAAIAALPGVEGLPERYRPLRDGADDETAVGAEQVLERAFLTAPAEVWVERLRAAGAVAAQVMTPDRDGFRRGVLDDPVNLSLGRSISYPTAPWGGFEQIGPLLRYGPQTGAGPRRMLPEVGEHTVEVLTELGFAADEIDSLLASKAAYQG